MRLKLKTKVALGGIFLFALLLLVGVVSFYYFNRLVSETGRIVEDNYESLEYARMMLISADSISQGYREGFDQFEKLLQQQEKNITEPGEKEITNQLRKHFNLWKNQSGLNEFASEIREDLSQIIRLNLTAIDKKNRQAQFAGDRAKTIVAIILGISFIAGVTFIFNFPFLVADPVAKLTRGIQAIAERNYGERIHLNRSDEFGEMASAFNHMAEKLDEYEHSNLASILFEKQRAETVIQSLHDASIGIGDKGEILFANRQALELLNLKEAELVGRNVAEMSKRNDLLRFLLQETNAAPFRIVIDGKEEYFVREVVDIKQDNKFSARLLQLKNITPFKELDVAKTNFIATISHELKTPLASSDFSIKLLENEKVGKLSPEQKELIESLRKDNQRMLRILSELLDLSQVETGRIQLNLQPVSPPLLFQKAVETVRSQLTEKNIKLVQQFGGDLPYVVADQEKTVWIINNFLTNAIRYTPGNGEIVLGLQKKDGNWIEFSVQDYGQGIDPSIHTKIFDRFFKGQGSPDRKGTGLGLAISKEFVEAMGGTIGVESKIGKGSRFFFQLQVQI